MRAVGLVALHVFRDSVRDKVLYSIVAFAVLLMAASYLIGQLTAGQDVKIIKDLGLAAMSLFGLFIAIFIGIGLIAKEIERRSLYAVIVKPVTRGQFIVGKYVGLVGTLAVNLAVMAAAFYAVLFYMSRMLPASALAASPAPAMDPMLLVAIALILGELALVTAVALFCSTFSSSALLSAALTTGVWVAGQFGAELRQLDRLVESPVAAAVGRGLYYVLPNFSAFDVKAQVVHGLPVTGPYVTLTVAYGAVYVALLLVAAVLVFSRRDLK
jgi:Cu-processing system permease protein